MAKQYYIGAYALAMLPNRNYVFFRKKRGPYTGLFDLLGGGVEPGENPEDYRSTLKRELKEEIGVDIESCEVNYLGHHLVSFQHLVHIGYLYFVCLPEETPLSSLDEEELGEKLLAPINEIPRWVEELTPLARKAAKVVIEV